MVAGRSLPASGAGVCGQRGSTRSIRERGERHGTGQQSPHTTCAATCAKSPSSRICRRASASILDCYFVDVELTASTTPVPKSFSGRPSSIFGWARCEPEKQAAAALYTPDFDRHGWHSPHTVIDVVTDDMPFLVDSITMVVYRHGLVIHRLLHPLLGAERKRRWHAAKHAAAWRCRQPAGILDSPRDRSHWRGRTDRSPCIRRSWACSLMCVRPSKMAPRCSERMRAAHDRDGWLRPVPRPTKPQRICAGSLPTILSFSVMPTTSAAVGDSVLARVADSGLGILRADHPRFGRCLAGIPGVVAELARDSLAVILVKADARSTVHRSAYLDFIGVKRYDARGNCRCACFSSACTRRMSITWRQPRCRCCDARLLPCGGYWLPAAQPSRQRPAQRARNLSAGRVDRNRSRRSDAHRARHRLLHEREQVRVFLRDDAWGRYVSAMVYMPRDRFDTTTRKRISALAS
jgi:glutamate dehydrogenase